MWLEGAALELRVELHADEPGVVRILDGLRQQAVRRQARKAQAGLLELVAIGRVDLVAVAVALGYVGRAVDTGDAAVAREVSRIGAEAHGSAEVAALASLLELVALHPFGHEADDRLRRLAELGRA